MANSFELPRLNCLRCGHEWIPRKPERPHRCPKCKSPYWDAPRKVEGKARAENRG